MKFQYKINGNHRGSRDTKDSAIRAARKAALSISDRGIIHVEVVDEASENVIHRDMVLDENIKSLETDDLASIGMIVPGTYKINNDIKPKAAEKLFKIGDYTKLNNELYKIISVSESCARAQPVLKKKVKIKDKLTDKEREFSITRRAVSLAPSATNVLTTEEVEKELKRIKELENGNSNTNSGVDRSNSKLIAQPKGKNSGTGGHRSKNSRKNKVRGKR
jgi:predicted DNA-binding helix-hairpin-helix protein